MNAAMYSYSPLNASHAEHDYLGPRHGPGGDFGVKFCNKNWIIFAVLATFMLFLYLPFMHLGPVKREWLLLCPWHLASFVDSFELIPLTEYLNGKADETQLS